MCSGLKRSLQSLKKVKPSSTAAPGLKRSLQSLKKVKPSSTASVYMVQFSFLLCCNGVARQVAGILQYVTCPLFNLFRNFLSFQQLHKVELSSTF